MEDDELKAMNNVYTALKGLDEDACVRVLRWVSDRLGVQGVVLRGGKDIAAPIIELGAPEGAQRKDFATFADLFNSANPSTSGEKALVAGYWLQINKGTEDFTGSAVNKELINLGESLANVTDAFNQLMSKKPKLAIQTKKSGKSQQARKQYKLTDPGIKTVEAMLKNMET